MTKTASKTIKFATWNIGGGILGESHQIEGKSDITYYCDFIKDKNPDILCLQEGHYYPKTQYDQAQKIQDELSYDHLISVPFSPSHLDKEAKFSLSILSRHPLIDCRYYMFDNPGFSAVGPNGQQWILFDKGYIKCHVEIEGNSFVVFNVHGFPLHYFGADARDEQFKDMWNSLSDTLISTQEQSKVLAAIDLNDPNFDDILPKVSSTFTNSITNTPTTLKGVQQDFITVSKGVQVESAQAIATNSDHHYCEAVIQL